MAANLLAYAAFLRSTPTRFAMLQRRRRDRGAVFACCVLTLLASSSVALLLWHARKARHAALTPDREGDTGRAPSAGRVGAENSMRIPGPPPLPTRSISGSSRGGPSEPGRDEARALETPYPVAVEVPWLNQAALAIQLTRPGELQRIARSMREAGHDMEAGLLGNYALLLERSTGARARILTEVTRLLRDAAELRQGSSRPVPRHAIPPGGMQHADAALETELEPDLETDEDRFSEDSSIHRIEAYSLLQNHPWEPRRASRG